MSQLILSWDTIPKLCIREMYQNIADLNIYEYFDTRFFNELLNMILPMTIFFSMDEIIISHNYTLSSTQVMIHNPLN